MTIPFNKPYLTGREIQYISEAHSNGQLAGDGYFTKKCNNWLENYTKSSKALLTHSCTGALEMAAILSNIRPGDEVIMPSYTFVSTANAFVARGGIPVFVDIRPDTLNINELLIEKAITNKTKAIVPVHYAGVSCEMDHIMKIANNYSLLVVEDAAQGVMGRYKGRPLGSIGHIGCYSFHETKNIISGEGGAILVNLSNLIDRAEIIREKGTNRTNFFRGSVDKYTWVDLGSSYLPGEISAAFLWAQIECANFITGERLSLWAKYHQALEDFEVGGLIRRPSIPLEAEHNGHMYFIRLKNLEQRTNFIFQMKKRGVNCVFHYVPLHSSPCGQKYGRQSGSLSVTDEVSDTIVRLPLWVGMEHEMDEVISAIKKTLYDIS